MTDSRHKFSSAFNRVVRRHRLARNLSQELLSERAAVDRTYVGLLERGQRSAGLDVAKRLAEALDLSLTQLVAEAEEEWRDTQLDDAHLDAQQPTVAERKTRWQASKRPTRSALPRRRGNAAKS
jgi:transcriptional regulator with XRE-family HTH domain